MIRIVERRPKVYGYHVYGDLHECDVEILGNEQKLKEVVEEAARRGNMTLLDVKSWKIGEGVSIVGIVLESHIAIHTWPEYRFATVDAYTCGTHTRPDVAFEYIVSALGAKRVKRGEFKRILE
ncbi:MAG: adenosylmethionine decarboxylase [Acidilobaceae archaeon]|nr:adenosylmethionine decarboxylase [Acidilobaceae archaeon]MCX8165586.1 adenosylmethionine decarboxylase [Acidilobaceae archaeon]MDW7974013.1 adenosylmethionine decarboxylase [Sulfolobales archaeon]